MNAVDPQKVVALNLTIDEVNYMLDCVGDRPFKQSAGFVNKIHSQVNPQLVPQPDGAPANKKEGEKK